MSDTPPPPPDGIDPSETIWHSPPPPGGEPVTQPEPTPPPPAGGIPATPPPAAAPPQPGYAPPQPGYAPPAQPGYAPPQPGYAPPAQPGYAPPQPGYAYAPQPYAAPKVGPDGRPLKSKMAAGLLGIFLGSFGVHRFYLGYPGIGIAQIVVTFVTCGIGGIWGLIEGIMILTGSASFATDAEGRPLTD
ncbi:MAG: NINE protein [Microthrixaceae bacterium]|nr:NINE protein [Microthrixaceae bacterium]